MSSLLQQSILLATTLSHQPPQAQLCGASAPPQNSFWLLQQYFSPSPLSHDPEELVNLSDLCDGHGETSDNNNEPHVVTQNTSLPRASFGPYPNESSFLLGEWYWNGGHQKSQEDFPSLLNTVG